MDARVLIVEDDSFTRASLTGSLRNLGVNVVAEVSSIAEAIRKFTEIDIDVVVLDLDFGSGPTGMDLARALRIKHNRLGIVMLTSYPDPRLLRVSLPDLPERAQYLVKSQIDSIEAVSQAIENSLLDSESLTANPRQLPELSDVQIETLRLVSQGLTNSEIAKQRFVSEKAVEQTISKIAKALDIPQTSSTNQRVHIAKVYFRLIGIHR